MNVGEINSWLPLTEYSTKHRISVSTLRRRIKADDIKFRFEDGKYFIMDEPMGTHQRVHRPSQESEMALVGAHQGMMKGNETMPSSKSSAAGPSLAELQAAQNLRAQELEKTVKAAAAHANNSSKDEPILTAANKLLNELKKAYTQILQEKEEQIFHLKDELSDLKTLVRVLESENDRLNGFKQ